MLKLSLTLLLLSIVNLVFSQNNKFLFKEVSEKEFQELSSQNKDCKVAYVKLVGVVNQDHEKNIVKALRNNSKIKTIEFTYPNKVRLVFDKSLTAELIRDILLSQNADFDFTTLNVLDHSVQSSNELNRIERNDKKEGFLEKSIITQKEFNDSPLEKQTYISNHPEIYTIK